eukprot:EG_transcript_12004
MGAPCSTPTRRASAHASPVIRVQPTKGDEVQPTKVDEGSIIQEEEEELSDKVRNATLPDASDALCDNRTRNEDHFAGPVPKIFFWGSPSVVSLLGSQRHVDYLATCANVKRDASGVLPEQWLLVEMEREWASLDAVAQWRYVVDPNAPGDDPERDAGRESRSLEAFLQHPIALASRLLRSEVIALRLYTGPGYRLINGYLRSLPQNAEMGWDKYFASVAGAPNMFPTTQHCLDAAVMKLIPHTPSRRLYRGMWGAVPGDFRQGIQATKKADQMRYGPGRPCEPAFLSTSAQRAVATKAFAAETLFIIEAAQGTQQFPDKRGRCLKAGAEVEWVTQYPGEFEVLFPSFTILQACPNPLPPEEQDLVQPGRAVFYLEPVVLTGARDHDGPMD